MNSRRNAVAPLWLSLLVAMGCDQFSSLKPSNSDEHAREEASDSDEYSGGRSNLDASVTPATPRDAGSTISNPSLFPSTMPAMCTAPRLSCGGSCTDVSISSSHCGRCNNSCSFPLRCTGGECVCSNSGQVQCQGKCTQPMLGVCGDCGQAESCLSEPVCDDGQSHVADWPTLAGDLRRSGYNAGELGVPPLTRAWALSLATTPLDPVVVAGSRVFLSTRVASPASRALVALDVKTGTHLWTKDFGAVDSLGSPAVASCRVYVEHGVGAGSAVGRLWSLSASNGEVIWGRANSSSLSGGNEPPMVTTSNVYAGVSDYRGLYAVTRSNGVRVFDYSDSSYSAAGTPAFHDGELYTYLTGKLERRNATTGVVLDTIGVAAGNRSRPVLASDGTAFLVGASSVYAFEVKTKRLLWQAGAKVTLPPAVAEGLALLIEDGVLTARDAKTGALTWTASSTNGLNQAPIAAHGFAYVASPTDTYAVSLATGAVVWQELGGGPLSIGNGHLLVAGNDGILRSYALTQPPAPTPPVTTP